jgi:hypothetical protein
MRHGLRGQLYCDGLSGVRRIDSRVTIRWGINVTIIGHQIAMAQEIKAKRSRQPGLSDSPLYIFSSEANQQLCTTPSLPNSASSSFRFFPEGW